VDECSIAHQLVLLPLLLAALLLTGCVRNPFERQSPHTQWVMAMSRGDDDAAQRRLVPSDAAAWRAATDQLRQQHGKIRALRRSDIPLTANAPYQSAVMLIGIDWADGYASCLRFQETPDGHLDMLDTGYRDCATLPWPPPPDP
jgi:hypothetical protein